MLSEKEKMLAGAAYSALDQQLVNERTKAKSILKKINQQFVAGKEISLLFKELLPNAAPDFYAEPPFHCDYGYNIYTGKRVYFNVGCVVLDVCKVSIGNYVFFGPGVQIYAATHPLDASQRRKKAIGATIEIGDDCWIGGNTIICPGVKIGARAIIGAGSVVTKNVPEDSIYAGNPARSIRKKT